MIIKNSLGIESIQDIQQAINKIQKSDFEKVVFNQPNVQQKFIQTPDNLKGKNIQHFHFGKQFTTIISEEGEIHSLENEQEQKKQSLRSKINPINVIKKIKFLKREKQRIIKKLYSNEIGQFLLLLGSRQKLSLYDNKNKQEWDLDFEEEGQIVCVNLLQSEEYLKILLGMNNGIIYQISIDLKKDIKNENISIDQIYQFSQVQYNNPVNDIKIHQYNNYLFIFISVGDKIYWMKSLIPLEDFLFNFEDIFNQNKKVLYNSEEYYNVMKIKSVGDYLILYIYSISYIKVYNFNINENQYINDIKLEVQELETNEKILFFEIKNHLFFGFPNGFKIYSIYQKRFIHFSDWKSMNISIENAKVNHKDNTIIIHSKDKLLQINLDISESNLWINDVSKGLFDLSLNFVSDKNLFMFINKLQGLANFKNRKYEQSIDNFINSDIEFEQLMNLYLKVKDKKFLVSQNLIKYLNVMIDQKEGFNQSVLLLIKLEIASFNYVKLSKIINQNNEKNLINNKKNLTFFFTSIKESLSDKINYKLFNNLLQQHQNKDFQFLLAEINKKQDFLINQSLEQKNYKQSIELAYHYFKHIIHNKQIENNQKRQKIRNLGDLIEKYSYQLYQKEQLEYTNFIKLVFDVRIIQYLQKSTYQQIISPLNKLKEKEGVKQILEIVKKFIVKLKKFKTKEEETKIIDIIMSLSYVLIYQYSKYQLFDCLNEFVLKFEGSSQKYFQRMYQYLLLRIKNKSKAQLILINAYGIMQQYYKAVKLSLEMSNQELAIKWASKCKNIQINKKIWMMIAKHSIEQSEQKLISLLQIKKCPLNIADTRIWSNSERQFKKLIEKHLDEQDRQLKVFNLKLEKYKKTADYINDKKMELEKKFIIMDLDKKCDICKEKNFNDLFYYFHCNHHFHKSCLKQRMTQMGMEDKLLRINQLESKRSFEFNVVLDKNPMEYSEQIQKLKRELNGVQWKQFLDYSEEIDQLYADECLFCGGGVIEWAYQDFIEDEDLFDININ